MQCTKLAFKTLIVCGGGGERKTERWVKMFHYISFENPVRDNSWKIVSKIVSDWRNQYNSLTIFPLIYM